MNRTTLLKSAIACALSVGGAGVATAATPQAMGSMAKDANAMAMKPAAKTMAKMQKTGSVACYGINAAYKNDCQSPGHSCAGQDSKARDPNAFVAVPAGLCKKIDGGHLKAM